MNSEECGEKEGAGAGEAEAGPGGPPEAGGPHGEQAVECDEGSRERFSPARMKAVLEAVLYVSGQPLTMERLVSVLGAPTRKDVRDLLDELNTEYLEQGRAFEVVEVANGFQVRTRPEFAPWIAKLQPQKPVRLTRAALETLAIVAYKQPATRAEVESIRGVDTGAVLGSLLEKRLVRVLGRKEIPGRPILYGTSQEFLDLFGLKNLASLPTLKEIEGMFARDDDEPGEALESPAAEAAPREGGGPGEAGEGGAPVGPGTGDARGTAEAGPSAAARGAAGLGAGEEGGGSARGVEGRDFGEDSRQRSAAGQGDLDEDVETWEEEDGGLETAELDALLRAAKTKVVSYEESREWDGEGEGEGGEGLDEEGLEEQGDGVEGSALEAGRPGGSASRDGREGEGHGVGAPVPKGSAVDD